MLHELIPYLPASKWARAPGSRSIWAYYPQELLRRAGVESGQCPDRPRDDPYFPSQSCTGINREGEEEKKETAIVAPNGGHSLFQESFFFCTVRNVGDAPGTGCIYVETVVDRDSGIAFAKVYSAQNAMNAVDILASRVVPFFERRGVAIKQIHTRKTSEYCGFVPMHPFETYLATSHIEHLPKGRPRQPDNFLCEQFYRLLVKEFFLPALRKTFRLSLDDLQRDLDAFVEIYNAMQMKRENEMNSALHASSNFPVDL